MTQQYAIRRKSNGFIMRAEKVYSDNPLDLGQWTLTDNSTAEVWTTENYTSADSTIKGMSNYSGEYFTPVLDGDPEDYEVVSVETVVKAV